MYRLLAISFGAILVMVALSKLSFAPGGSSDIPSGPGFTVAQADVQAAAADGVGQETEIERDGSGQFHLSAQVNGQDAKFLIDTGADSVAFGLEEAERLGIDFDRDSFEPITQTASGIGYGARVQLDQVQVAGQRFDGVDAIIIDGLQTNLLGQSLLSRMGKVELHGDRMVINRN
jgi:aspartyl protease family protein